MDIYAGFVGASDLNYRDKVRDWITKSKTKMYSKTDLGGGRVTYSASRGIIEIESIRRSSGKERRREEGEEFHRVD